MYYMSLTSVPTTEADIKAKRTEHTHVTTVPKTAVSHKSDM